MSTPKSGLSQQTIILSNNQEIIRMVSHITGSSQYQQGQINYNGDIVPVYRDTRESISWHEDAELPEHELDR